MGNSGFRCRKRFQRKIVSIWISNSWECRYNLREEDFISLNHDPMATVCKHPKVRIVSRHEDSEFVECLECGDVFDSDEFRDMEIEETAELAEASDDN
jgi:hypothetical protein